MEESEQKTLDARNEAFRCLGRNLYLIQLIEHQLKHLVVHASVEGYAGELVEVLAKKSKLARKASMGTLTSQLTTAVFRDTADERREPGEQYRGMVFFLLSVRSRRDIRPAAKDGTAKIGA